MPPFVGVAVNVTDVPAQIVLPGLAAILTDGATLVVTDIVIAFEPAVAGLAQVAADAITQVTISPFARLVLLYELPLAPTLLPFSFH